MIFHKSRNSVFMNIIKMTTTCIKYIKYNTSRSHFYIFNNVLSSGVKYLFSVEIPILSLSANALYLILPL